MEQLIKELLDDRLSVTARDTDHRNVKPFTVIGSQLLQGSQGVFDNQEIRALQLVKLRQHLADHEIANPEVI